MGDDPGEVVILDGFEDGAVTVQDGLPTVGAGCGSVGRSSVEGGDREAYLHGVAALLSGSRNGSSHNRFYFRGAPLVLTSHRPWDSYRLES